MLKEAIEAEIDLQRRKSGITNRLQLYNLMKRNIAFSDFVRNTTVGEICANISRSSNVRFYFDVAFCKIGASGADATSLHQDAPSFGFKGDQIPSLWLALSDVPLEAGPLVFALGSHRLIKQVFRPAGSYQQAPIEGYEDHSGIHLALAKHDLRLVPFLVNKGDAIVIHPRVIHGSLPVSNPQTCRIGYCTRWLGDDAIWSPSIYTESEEASYRVPMVPGISPPAATFSIVKPSGKLPP